MAVEYTKRVRRDSPKPKNSDSQFIKSEKDTTGENIIWRDNSETRKQGHVPTVTRVLYHGMYPSLNVSVPLNSSYASKFRQKRGGGGVEYTMDKDLRQTTSGKVRESQTSGKMNDLVEATQKYRQETRTIQMSFAQDQYHKKPIGGDHYERADHLTNTLENAYLSVDTFQPKNVSQGSLKYRTMYLPNTEYQGDPENKGRVKLISVGYYSVNDSTADLRSYSNPPVRRHTHSRTRRSTNWAWLDKVLESIWTLKNPEKGEQDNDIPRSEPLTLEVSEVNKEAQDVYGYSSNGHPHNLDRIYLVQNNIIQPNPPKSDQKSATLTAPQADLSKQTDEQSEEMSPSLLDQTTLQREEMSPLDLPKEGTNLIQAPERRIICYPPKRYARGRCRTVWRS